MNEKTKNSRGVITVMISLMLTGILSLGTMVIEAGRLQAARTQLDDANLSAGTSMIAAYNAVLYERFGLLAIDNDRFSLERFRDYLEFNSERDGVYGGNNISTFYTVKTAELEGLYNLTYPAVLKRQLTSRAKYHVIPQDYALNYYNMDYFLEDYQSKAAFVSEQLGAVASNGSQSDIPAEMSEALGYLYEVFGNIKEYDETYNVTVSDADMSLLPSRTGTVESTVFADDAQVINAAVRDAGTVLGSSAASLASGGSSVYSETDVSVNVSSPVDYLGTAVNPQSLASNAGEIVSTCRKLVQGINAALNMLSADREGTLLLNSYIAGYFPNKNFAVDGYSGNAGGAAVSGVNSSAFAGACVEYAVSGDKSEINNQQTAYKYIIATRLVGNLYSVIKNSSSFNAGSACSAAAHIAWAYFESFADTELLFRYNAVVPLNKDSMILPVDNPSAVGSAFASKEFPDAMKALGILQEDKIAVGGYDKTNYRDALALALWFVPNSKKMLRVADLVQLEMRFREVHVEKTSASFLMSEQNTFCRVKCTGNLNSVLPVISLNGSGGVKGTPIQSIKYVGY